MRRKQVTLTHAVLAAAILFGSAGCTRIDNALASVPFLAFMRSSPSFDPYESPRPAPPGAVPFDGPLGEAIPPIASVQLGPSRVATEGGLREFASGPWGQNPFAGEDLLPLGQAMYDRHCAVCHGTLGLADGGAVARPGEDKYPAIARNLTLPVAVALPDGYIYGIIRAGRGLMPPYGARITHRERWAIVEYVRELQRRAGTLPATGAAQQTAPGGE